MSKYLSNRSHSDDHSQQPESENWLCQDGIHPSTTINHEDANIRVTVSMLKPDTPALPSVPDNNLYPPASFNAHMNSRPVTVDITQPSHCSPIPRPPPNPTHSDLQHLSHHLPFDRTDIHNVIQPATATHPHAPPRVVPPVVARRRPGRPIGSRTKRKWKDEYASSRKRSAIPKDPGCAFSDHEALAVAKSWIEHSHITPSHSIPNMWVSIQSIAEQRYGTIRTTESLRCAWMRIARNVLFFMEAVMEARSKGKFSMGQAMDIYQMRAGKKGPSGEFKTATPFKYFLTAQFLSHQTKFQTEYMPAHFMRHMIEDMERIGIPRKLDQVIDLTIEGQDIQPEPIELVPTNERISLPPDGVAEKKNNPHTIGALDYANRPLSPVGGFGTVGHQTVQGDHVSRQGGSQIVGALSDIAVHMEKANSLFVADCDNARQAANTDEDLRLLNLIDRDSPEYAEILHQLLASRRNRLRCHHFRLSNV